VKTKLLWSFAVILDDAAILLGLWCTKLRPELNDVVSKSLNVRYPTRVFLIDPREFGVELVDI
jgi:hypothetical protein